MIFTDTDETEKNYFLGLKNSLPEILKDNIAIKVKKLELKGIVEYINKEIALNPQYSEPWIVFDRDNVVNFDKIILDAEASGISVGWSNPCIEIWFSAYFGKMPNIIESTKCCTTFSELYKLNTDKEYKKSDKNIYDNPKIMGMKKKRFH